MGNIILSNKLSKVVLVDFILLAVVYFLPAMVHYVNYPLYYFEPMRIALFISLFFLKDKRNAYFLAVTLPLFSYVVSGHPVAIKNVIMAIELIINVFFLFSLSRRVVNPFLVIFISILASKSVYYFLKYLAIKEGLLSAALFDTPFNTQIVIMILLSFGYMYFFNVKKS